MKYVYSIHEKINFETRNELDRTRSHRWRIHPSKIKRINGLKSIPVDGMGRAKPCLEEQRKSLSSRASIAWRVLRKRIVRSANWHFPWDTCVCTRGRGTWCMHTQKAARAKVVGLWKLLLRKAQRRRRRRVSGERRRGSFERSRDVGRRVKKSERRREKRGRFFTRWKEGRSRKRRRKAGDRCLGFASSWKSACVRNAVLVTDPSLPFLHPGRETLLTLRPAFDDPKNGFFRWKGSLARWRKEIPFSDPRLVRSSGVQERRDVETRQSWIDSFVLRVFPSFQEFSSGNFEERKKEICNREEWKNIKTLK